LTTDSDKYVYIENPNLLQITVNLDQVDIAKVSIGTKAIVTFDAYTTSPANAVITSIDTAPITTS
jgi:multidrug resistance efflux pump